MLNFWYSARCTRGMKIGICITTCAIIYFCSHIQKLAPVFAISCLAIGVIEHFIRHLYQHLDQDSPHRSTFKVMEMIFPVMTLILVILSLPQTQKTVLALQAIAFSALGLFMVSIYQNRAPR